MVNAHPPFALMSRRPGIGDRYVHTHRQWHIQGLKNYTQVNGVYARLPRFYKEKFFTPLQRERMALDSLVQADSDYWEEMNRLKKFHRDPQAYYEECIVHAHDQVKSKLNDNSIF